MNVFPAAFAATKYSSSVVQLRFAFPSDAHGQAESQLKRPSATGKVSYMSEGAVEESEKDGTK